MCIRDRRGHCLVGSMTGVVASKRVTEASKGALRPIGNRSQSVMAVSYTHLGGDEEFRKAWALVEFPCQSRLATSGAKQQNGFFFVFSHDSVYVL